MSTPKRPAAAATRSVQSRRSRRAAPPLRSRPTLGTRLATGAPNKSLAKALRILDCLGQSGGESGIMALAGALQINKTTVHRLLAVLKQFGYVEQQDENGTYRLGLKLFELGTIAAQSRLLQDQARPLLLEMARLAKETVHLAILEGRDVVYLDKLEARNTFVTVPSAVGRRLPGHCTGVGKVLLAHVPEEELDALLDGSSLTAYTENTLTTRGALKAELRRVRAQGYAIDDQEVERGLRCTAAAIRNHEGRVVAAISISGPSIRFEGEELADKIALVKDFAEKISRSLYYRGGAA